MDKRLIFLVFAIVIVIVGFLGFRYLNNRQNINGLIIKRENAFEPFIMKDYTTYEKFMKEHNGKLKLTKSHFDEYDYIVDYIPYVEDLVIENIGINVKEKNLVEITYSVTKTDENSKMIFINFIPIDKNIMDDKITVNRIMK